MNKNLFALAVFGALAGAASAQTSVTLYGIADVGIGMADTDAPGSDNAVNVFSGVQSGSRFGIRGTEDLGGGLRATFNLEHGVDWDDGDSTSGVAFWQRRAYVGLDGGLGEVRLGRDYTPGFASASTTDVMGYGLFGTWLSFTGQGSVGNPLLQGVQTRASNGVHYTSPNWGGLTLRAMYSTGEADNVTRPSGDFDSYGLSGVWTNGPLTVQGYWQTLEFDTTRVVPTSSFGTADVAQYGVGAQYRFSIFRVAFNYGMADFENPLGGSVEHEGWQLGGGVKLGVGEVLLSYIKQEINTVDTPEGDTWGLAYVHPLSKRTNLYASYGQTDNKNGGQFGLFYAQNVVNAGAPDATPKAFAVGIRHLF